MTLDVSSDAQRRRLRDVLGTFATGVTVVTARNDAGVPVGITVNSFTSVSLEPPLVLWCLGRGSSVQDAFTTGSHFAVNVLNGSQEALAKRFANKQLDQFADLEDIEQGIGGVPLLPDCIGQLQCVQRHALDGGDHLILVGEVLAIAEHPGAPLLFHRGRFAALGEQSG